MYIDYNKLLKLLADKSMSKTDLMEITEISPRVLAKLSKNESVTTDTISRICSALNCDVGDIMEYVSEERLSIYAAYKKHSQCMSDNELFQTFQFTMAGQKYTVYQSKQIATKATHIHCKEDGAVYWEQFYAVGLANTSEKTLLIKPCRSADEVVIVLIKGKPAVIVGLDENCFVSSRGVQKNKSDIYVMSEAAFKLFSPQAF